MPNRDITPPPKEPSTDDMELSGNTPPHAPQATPKVLAVTKEKQAEETVPTQKQKQVPTNDPLESIWRTEVLPSPTAQFLIPLRGDPSDTKVMAFLENVKEQVAKQKKVDTQDSAVEKGTSLKRFL